MKQYCSRKPPVSRVKQAGTFMVEFALVGVIFATAIAFCSDSVITIATKGKLDRLVYSGVSLLKERTALFNPDSLTVSTAEFNQLNSIMQNSFERMTNSFDVSKYGVKLETWTPESGAVEQTSGALTCSAKAPLTGDMSVMTSWGRRASLYRLTVCYEVPSWFSQGQETVQSSALMIGR
ncbi:tight adherence pilus pseudopilin TadF [Marinomonas gallaica]|uniref:tight adherence pilus pseudopilin TadF n=1 Tax=Marinomonas gallaica TaxID=1806667 RepID=UPI00082F4679|nr:tight adherence pilus pseudopilin TadF [Marinomonas gallaica]